MSRNGKELSFSTSLVNLMLGCFLLQFHPNIKFTKEVENDNSFSTKYHFEKTVKQNNKQNSTMGQIELCIFCFK